MRIAAAPVALTFVLLVTPGCSAGAPSTDSAAAPPPSSTVPDRAPPLDVTYQADGRVWVRTGAVRTDVGNAVEGEPQHPDWSPDGARLVFETDADTIWSVAADGSEADQLYRCEAPCSAIQDPAWSPDGAEIAFVEVRTRDGITTSSALLRVVDVASTSTRTVREDHSGVVWYFSPRWSDDGLALVVEEDVWASDRLDEDRLRRFRVVTVSVDGHRRRVVASWPGPLVGPGAPTPDWHRATIVFSREDDLVAVPARGGREDELTAYDGVTEHALQPTFSPDGSAVTFTYVTGTFGVDDEPQGALLDLASGEVTMLGLEGATHVRAQP